MAISRKNPVLAIELAYHRIPGSKSGAARRNTFSRRLPLCAYAGRVPRLLVIALCSLGMLGDGAIVGAPYAGCDRLLP
jgi:hypothetical protein